MDSINRLSIISKYILLIIIGLFVAAVFNGARPAGPGLKGTPEHMDSILPGNPDKENGEAMYNEIYPVNYLELIGENKITSK